MCISGFIGAMLLALSSVHAVMVAGVLIDASRVCTHRWRGLRWPSTLDHERVSYAAMIIICTRTNKPHACDTHARLRFVAIARE